MALLLSKYSNSDLDVRGEGKQSTPSSLNNDDYNKKQIKNSNNQYSVGYCIFSAKHEVSAKSLYYQKLHR